MPLNFIMGNAATTSWSNTFSDIKSKHDSAYYSLEEAIKLEEQEKPKEAIEKYKQGIAYIDAALSIQVTCPENPEPTWERACLMIQKMKKTRAEVLMRINSIGSSVLPEEPPSYEEAVSSSSSTSGEEPRTYMDLAAALQQLQVDPNLNMNTDLIYTYDNVKLYFISPNGDVISTSQPECLKIAYVDDDSPNSPTAILQVGDWVYPLVPGVSPCYRTEYGAFILPDVYSEVQGSCVGIMLPADADKDVFDLLENILHGIISQASEVKYRKGEKVIPMIRDDDRGTATVTASGPVPVTTPQSDLSTKISNGIITGAQYISLGILKGAEKATYLLDSGTPKLINNMRPSDQPAQVPEKVARGIQIAGKTTGKAAEITGFVANKIGDATVKLGHFLAPHIQKQGTRLLSTGLLMSEADASAKVKGVLTVAAGAVEGFSTVYSGLEQSAALLGNNLKNNTVKVVEHKYGMQVGECTGETFNAVGNVYSISRDARILRPKGLLRRAAKDTGRALCIESVASTSFQEILPPNSKEQKLVLRNEKEEEKEV